MPPNTKFFSRKYYFWLCWIFFAACGLPLVLESGGYGLVAVRGLLIAVASLVVFPGGSDGKESTCNEGDPGSIPGSRRFPGEGNGNPLQYSCLENPMDRGAWYSTIHGVAKRHD